MRRSHPFQQTCLMCSHASAATICAICQRDINQRLNENRLSQIGASIELQEVKKRSQIKEICCLGWYQWPVDSLIVMMKFQRRTLLAKKLCQWFITHSLKTKPLPDALIAVPMSRWRIFLRGYNQAHLLAKELSGVLKIKDATASISRVNKTSVQHRLSRNERLTHNIKFACVAFPKHVRSVAIVDDVVTTGSTLTAMAEAIRRSNPHVKIHAWVMGVTPKSR